MVQGAQTAAVDSKSKPLILGALYIFMLTLYFIKSCLLASLSNQRSNLYFVVFLCQKQTLFGAGLNHVRLLLELIDAR